MAKQPRFQSVQSTPMIRGFSRRVQSLANPNDLRSVVGSLAIGHLDPLGREITDIGSWQARNRNISVRLDRQANPSADGANLQIQVNDAALKGIRLTRDEGTTIAQVLVPESVYRKAMASDLSVRTHLENVVRSALLSSTASLGFPFAIQEVAD